MLRLIRRPVPFFGLAIVLLAIPIWWWRYYRPPVIAVTTTSGLNVMLIRAGLDAKALAAAGVSSASISGLVQVANTHVAAHVSDLASADSAFANARRESDRLKGLIESGRGSAADVTAYQTSSASLASATTQRQAALDALFNAATANLSTAQRNALTRIRANRSWELPLEFLVVDRSEPQWVALRDALANERIAAKLHDTPDADAQASLATWRSNGAVASARSSLDTTLTTVTSSWNAAAGD